MDNNVYYYPQQYYYQPPVVPKRNYKPLDKKDLVFMALFFISAFLLVCLGLFGEFNLGFTVSYVILFAITSLYLFKKSNVFSIICGLLSIAASVEFTLFDDPFVNFFMLILIAGLYIIYAVGISDNFNFNKGSFKMAFDVAISTFVNPFRSFGSIVGGSIETAKGKKGTFGWLIGIVVAIPFMLVIIPLLVSSDAAFEGLLSGLGENVFEAVVEIIMAVIITPYLIAFAFEKRKNLYKKDKMQSVNTKKIPASACISFLSMISVVYVVYLFSQLAYFFSAFKGILPEGYEYTASEFARRGFFEMCAICVINLIVISLVSIFAKKKNLAVKILSCFISAFSILLIATALQKMALNVSIYGLSKNRVMVSVFMIMMLVVIAFFVLHIFAPKISYMQPIIIVCSIIFIALGFSNLDARIAQYNINAYETGQIDDLDLDELTMMSNSTLPYIADLMDSKNPEIAKESARIIADKYYEYFGNESEFESSIRSYNYSNMQAVLTVDDCNGTPLYNNILSIITSGDYYSYNEIDDTYEVYKYGDDDEGYNDYWKMYSFDKEQGLYVLSNPENDRYQID